ncbi:MAG TPA: AIM24 family protein, partial [Prolixibacteraceae bacterium]|nr:AIM24 family protein [Prolixibacteraceae bacterium]
VDTGCVVGFTNGIDFDIQQAGGLKSMVFGGEGMFLATLRGHGKVWLQSMPISKLVRELSSMGGNQRKETGGFLNQFLQD